MLLVSLSKKWDSVIYFVFCILVHANRHYIQDVESNDKFVLKEPYAHLDTKKNLLRSENMYYWDENVINPIG